ncbi:acyl carrier protein [Streptomyces anulatus]|uniref:acyl carrier protein n=1 Tax=Streptomyces anulatus TaxID=1892 RepID=UPI001C5FADBB|nr:acyl carrier protein [Streptomyces anulatus]QYA97455.1 acyl carrier protein [Streptomyces anulatus]
MTQRHFTFDDLRIILREAAGLEDEVLGDAALDAAFEDLGLESLALLETGSRIEREYGITLDDSSLTGSKTPRALLEIVNGELATAAA